MAVSLNSGVWGVVATPFNEGDLTVDHDSLRRLVQNYESIGVAGLTVLGVFGEAARLDSSERAAVLKTVRDAVALPLVIGATALSTAPVIEEVTRALDVVGERLAGAMIQLNSASPGVVTDHLSAVHAATGAGIVMQNYPVASGVNVPLRAEIEIARNAPGIVAVKEEAPPTAQRIAELTATIDVPVFGGLGGITLIDELTAGASGAMTGFSYPEGLLAAISGYALTGFAGARDALTPFLPLISFEQQPAIALGIRKYCLQQRGLIASAAVRPPAADMPPSLKAIADVHLSTMNQLLETGVAV